jgi:hypothetical protein
MNNFNLREMRELQQLATDVNATLAELHDQLGGIVATMTGVRESYAELPTVWDLDNLVEPASRLCGALEAAKDVWESLPEVGEMECVVEQISDHR